MAPQAHDRELLGVVGGDAPLVQVLRQGQEAGGRQRVAALPDGWQQALPVVDHQHAAGGRAVGLGKVAPLVRGGWIGRHRHLRGRVGGASYGAPATAEFREGLSQAGGTRVLGNERKEEMGGHDGASVRRVLRRPRATGERPQARPSGDDRPTPANIHPIPAAPPAVARLARRGDRPAASDRKSHLRDLRPAVRLTWPGRSRHLGPAAPGA